MPETGVAPVTVDGNVAGPSTQVSAPVLMATAGATGKERVRSNKKHRHRHHRRPRSSSASGAKKSSSSAPSKKRSKSSGGEGGKSTTATNLVVVPAAPPVFDDAPLVKDDNMAGYVDRHARTVLGVESKVVKVVTPVNQNKLTYEPFIHFRIRSASDEHIRFRQDSLTLMIYATMANQSTADQNKAPDDEVNVARHALNAAASKPFMWMDPSVGATGFFSHLEVLVDNVPINSNLLMGGLWLQYTRVCDIFTNRDSCRLRSNKDLDPTKIANTDFQALREAVLPFSYGKWDSVVGRRIEAKLRGAFPFEFKNEAAASADNLKQPNYYFPPNTTFDFRFHFHPDKFAAVFHPKIASNMTEYFDKTGDASSGYGVGDLKKLDLRFQINQAFLEYDVVKLRSQQSIEYLELMRKGVPAIYRYDVIRGQHVSLPSKQAYVDVAFTIAPFARLLYVMFLPSWGVMPMSASYRRPLSGLSRFPPKCTKLSMVFAGQTPLITSEFERLGFPGEQHHTSHRILYHYLTSHRVWPGTFDELFPNVSDIHPFNQMFYVDLRSSMSDKAEPLNIKASFADSAGTSPEDTHVVVVSVHSTGEVTCRHSGGSGHYDWRWESKY